MKAVLHGSVVAEADRADLISIEGNWYFPRSSVVPGTLVESPTPYTCPWKGECQYYTVRVGNAGTGDAGTGDAGTGDAGTGDAEAVDAAWSYEAPYPSAIEKVGRDFSGYVAFWKDVEVGD